MPNPLSPAPYDWKGFIQMLVERLKVAKVSDEEIETLKNPPTANPPEVVLKLARRLAEAHAAGGEPVGACRFTDNGLACCLNTTQPDCVVIGKLHGGSTWESTPGQEGWFPATPH